MSHGVGFVSCILCGLNVDIRKFKNCIKKWLQSRNGVHLAWFLQFVVLIYLVMQHLSQGATILVMKDSFCLAPGITANHFSNLARSRSIWLACRRGGTDSALVDCQLLTLITSHMCHSKHMRCTDVINGTDVINNRIPEWLSLQPMNKDNEHEFEIL